MATHDSETEPKLAPAPAIDQARDGRIEPEASPAAAPAGRRWRRWIVVGVVGAAVLMAAVVYGVPWYQRYVRTITTDDAYVNGHVSVISARITDNVAEVLVD